MPNSINLSILNKYQTQLQPIESNQEGTQQYQQQQQQKRSSSKMALLSECLFMLAISTCILVVAVTVILYVIKTKLNYLL